MLITNLIRFDETKGRHYLLRSFETIKTHDQEIVDSDSAKSISAKKIRIGSSDSVESDSPRFETTKVKLNGNMQRKH